MQRYFFELRLGDRRLRDDEGEAFANPAEALKYARLVASELLQGDQASTMVNGCVAVLDESGRELGRIFLADISAATDSLQRSGRVLQ